MTIRTDLYVSNELAGVDELRASLTRFDSDFIARDDFGEAVAVAFLNRTVKVIVLDQRHNTSANSKLAHMVRVVRPEAKLMSLYTQLPRVQPEHIDLCLCVANDLESIARAISSILDPERVAT
jgi:hypothetical protein